MRKLWSAPLVVFAILTLAACTQQTGLHGGIPDGAALSISDNDPLVGEDFEITYSVPPRLADNGYVGLLIFDESGHEVERWEHYGSGLSPSRDVVQSYSHDTAERLHIRYVVMSGGNNFPGTPMDRYVYVGGRDDSDPDTNACDVINYFNIRLTDGSYVDDGDHIDNDIGFGFSVNWGVEDVSDVESIDLTLYHEGDQFFHSSADEDSEYTDWDEEGDGDYRAELAVTRDGDRCTQAIDFQVDDAGGSGTGDGDGSDTTSCDIISGEAFILCREDGSLIDDGDTVNLSTGDVITAVWQAGGTYSSTWFSVYDVDAGRDVYTSSAASGYHEFEMGDDIAPGDYQLRFSVYDPTRVHRTDITVE